MFCPTCRGAYREGIVICPTCHQPLTLELSAQPPAPAVQRLPTAATLAMIGTVLIFSIRTLGTFYISPNLIVARAVSTVFCMSFAAIIIFFLVFLNEAVDETQRRLKWGTWAALGGCVSAAVIEALNLLILFDRPVVGGHLLGVASSIASTLIPVTSVLFFAAFWLEKVTPSARLANAVKRALLGATLSASAHGVAVAFVGLSLGPPGDVHIIPLVAGISIVTFAVGTWLYFLWVIRLSCHPASPR